VTEFWRCFFETAREPDEVIVELWVLHTAA
jgi:hypothetical protein